MSRAARAALALLMAAAAGVVAAGPARADATTPPADCGKRVHLAAPEKGRDGSVPQPRPHADGHYTPILLVHGWRGNPDMWSQPTNMSTLKLEPSVNHSLLGNLQKFAGAAVYTLDYSDVAQKWFREPGAGGDQFVAAEQCLTGNAAFKGHKLMVVAHSMGGLITRWALSDAAPDGAARRGRVGLIMTLGTPYEGSIIAGLGTVLFDTAVQVGAKVDKRIATIVAIMHVLITLCRDVNGFGPCDVLNYVIDAYAAAKALSYGSPEMRALSAWPKGTDVETLASRTIIEQHSLFFLKGPDADVGDAVVDTFSATSGDHPERVSECRLTDSPVAALWDSLMVDAGQKSDLDARTYWPLAVLGACFHTNEARLIQHVNEILGVVGDELAKSEPSYAYLTGDTLAVVRNDRVAYQVPGAFRGDPGWTDNGRYAYAVTTGGQLAFLDTATGEQGTVRCKCEEAVPVDSSRVAWVDSAGKVTVQDLRDRTVAAPIAVALPAGRRPRHVLAGGHGGYALLAGDDLYWVDAAGKARLVHSFPAVEEVFAAATDGGKLVYEVVEAMGDCAHPSPVFFTDLATMTTTATKTGALQPGPGDDADVGLRDAWWGRDGRLYATLSSWVCDPYGGIPIMPASLWRLDGDTWVSVDGGPLQSVRQVTGTLKAVVVENGTLYSELNGKGTQIANDVRGIAMPAGITDPTAVPTGKSRGQATGPCLNAADFKKVADKEGPTIFEGAPVHFAVSGDVTCQSGYAYAQVTGYSIDWIILRYGDGNWHWAADPYWQQYGDRAAVCSAVPQKIRTAMRC
ncbi:esterase/lipase family protein [Dactylosporangium sp. NPDC051541]|uniref:esterase/lipase family protein n=1 Tax=Dactylosporangium sp. NPDC051541 TaxID=3363977 RepID=UPI00378AF3CA